jgi:hypothetical protein
MLWCCHNVAEAHRRATCCDPLQSLDSRPHLQAPEAAAVVPSMGQPMIPAINSRCLRPGPPRLLLMVTPDRTRPAADAGAAGAAAVQWYSPRWRVLRSPLLLLSPASASAAVCRAPHASQHPSPLDGLSPPLAQPQLRHHTGPCRTVRPRLRWRHAAPHRVVESALLARQRRESQPGAVRHAIVVQFQFSMMLNHRGDIHVFIAIVCVWYTIHGQKWVTGCYNVQAIEYQGTSHL